MNNYNIDYYNFRVNANEYNKFCNNSIEIFLEII